MARENRTEPDPSVVRAQAAATLTVYHRRSDNIVLGNRSRVNTCRLQIPIRITLVGQNGEELAPIGKVGVRKSSSDKSIQGAGVVAVATFDWMKALALTGGGQKLIVAVEFADGKHPARIEFDEDDLQGLTPT